MRIQRVLGQSWSETHEKPLTKGRGCKSISQNLLGAVFICGGFYLSLGIHCNVGGVSGCVHVCAGA